MDSVKEMLSDQTKGKNRAQDILCYLFREVLLWRGITFRHWLRRQEVYFEKPHNKINPDKGNLNKALQADTMNWGAFVKGMDFLNPVKATLDVIITWKDDVKVTYPIIIDPLEDDTNPQFNDFPWKDCVIFNNAKPASTLMAHLFRHIVATECKRATKDNVHDWWKQLFDDYATNPANVVGLKVSEINKDVNKIRRALMEQRVSWNNLRRGIHLLKPKKEEYRLTLQWVIDPVMKEKFPDSVHSINIVNPHNVV